MGKNRNRPLTQKQENFCLKYIETGNATEAYAQAYNAERMKRSTITEKASHLLSEGNISARVEELRAGAMKRNDVTIDKIVKELAKVAFVDIGNLYDDDGSLKTIREIKEDHRRAISEITARIEKSADGDVAEVIKYKLHDKTKALDLLMRHLGGYSNDNHQKQDIIIIGANPLDKS